MAGRCRPAGPSGRSSSIDGSCGCSPRLLSARQLELELDAFDGPFDLMLTLVLKEELELSDVHVVEIVLAFVERLAEREQLDLEVAGEFLVLVAALLELKGRALAPAGAAADDDALEELLDADAAAAELAQRLARYRRIRAAADWLRGRLEEQSRGSSPCSSSRPRSQSAAARIQR